MSKMSELSLVLDEMIACGEGMIRAAQALKEIFSESSEPETPSEQTPVELPKEETPAEPVKEYTFEDVRKAFSQKSHAGHTDAVKALIGKFGADKLSKVSKDDYPALMAELEAIG